MQRGKLGDDGGASNAVDSFFVRHKEAARHDFFSASRYLKIPISSPHAVTMEIYGHFPHDKTQNKDCLISKRLIF